MSLPAFRLLWMSSFALCDVGVSAFSVAGRVGRTPKVTMRSAAALAIIPQSLAKARPDP
jgi:hypothetical protein